jgi:hypothetical protein
VNREFGVKAVNAYGDPLAGIRVSLDPGDSPVSPPLTAVTGPAGLAWLSTGTGIDDAQFNALASVNVLLADPEGTYDPALAVVQAGAAHPTVVGMQAVGKLPPPLHPVRVLLGVPDARALLAALPFGRLTDDQAERIAAAVEEDLPS